MICLYHSKEWRNKFQFLINRLTEKVIPKKHIKRMCLVCTCKPRNDYYFEDYVGLEAVCETALIDYFDHDMQNNSELWSPSETDSGKTLEKAFREIMNDSRKDMYESKWRFMLLVRNCLQENYCIFTKRPPKVQPPTKEVQFAYQEVVSISFKAKYLGCLFGQNGKHIKEICRENQCEMSLRDPKSEAARSGLRRGRNQRMHYISSNIFSRPIKMQVFFRSHDKQGKENAQSQLEALMAKVTAKLTKHETHMKEFRIKRRAHLARVSENRRAKRQYRIEHDIKITAFEKRFQKEYTQEDFSKKKFHSIKEKEARARKIKASEEQGGRTALNGGHCKHCLSPFTSVVSMHDTQCRHHPGYLVLARKDAAELLTTPSPPPTENPSSNSDEDELLAKLAEGDSSDSEGTAQTQSRHKNHKQHRKPAESNHCKAHQKKQKTKRQIKSTTGNSEESKENRSGNNSPIGPEEHRRSNSDLDIKDSQGHFSRSSEDSDTEQDHRNRTSSASDRNSENAEDEMKLGTVSERKNTVYKWTCCNTMLFDVPKGTRMEKNLYNHTQAGCKTDRHVFVPKKEKRGRKTRSNMNAKLMCDVPGRDQDNFNMETLTDCI